MTDNLQTILTELYQIDPELRKYERELGNVIERMLANRPMVKLDANFAAQLRTELIEIASTKKNVQPKFLSLLINTMFMKKMFYIGGGVIVVTLLLVPAVSYFFNITKSKPQPSDSSSVVAIHQINDRAFGSLATLTTTAQNAVGATEVLPTTNDQPAATPNAANTNAAKSALLAAPMPIGIGGGSGVAVGGVATPGAIIAQPNIITNYRFVYHGEPIKISDAKMNVLERIKSGNSVAVISPLLNDIGMGAVNLSSFSALSVQNVTLEQKNDNGYVINLSLTDGSVSINQNWPSWQGTCNGAGCVQPEAAPIKAQDLPPDSDIIAIADAFIKTHGINMQNYGSGEIQQQNYPIVYGNANSKTMPVYYGNTITVIYPLAIQGKIIYEQDGSMKVGMMVAVSISQKAVSSLYNLTTQNYQSSAYETETDVKRIMDIASQGGLNNYVNPDASKTIDVEIGAPQIEYVRMWNYQNNQTSELLVPALVFPITGAPDNQYFYQKNIVIPLIKELLDQQNNPPIRIMKSAPM